MSKVLNLKGMKMKKEEKVVVSSMMRGFTLVEMLVVIAIIGMLATLAVKNLMPSMQTASITTAEAGARSLYGDCVTYQLKHKKYPTSLDQLCEGDDPILDSDKPLYDPWDNKYEIEVKGKGRLVIKSAGPNGVMGDEDDIHTDSKKKKD